MLLAVRRNRASTCPDRVASSFRSRRRPTNSWVSTAESVPGSDHVVVLAVPAAKSSDHVVPSQELGDNYEINEEHGTARPESLMLIVGCRMPLVLLTPSMIIFQLHCQMYLSKLRSISPLMSYLCLVKIFFISMLINIFIVYTISQEFSQSCYSPEIADIIEFT